MAKGYVGAPTSYTSVEYIESSGTQYIDTRVYPNANIHCEVDFQLVSVSGSGGIIGGWEASKGMLFGVNGSNFQFAFGTSAWAGSTIAYDLNRHTVYMNDSNGDGRLDNTILASHSNVVSLVNTNKSMYLFRSNGGSNYTNVKIYSCKIYDGTTLIRNFIPALDQDNVACMYEQVEGKFYRNQGSGTFTAGSTTGQPVSLGDKARKLKKGYVGINDVARKIIRGYVGVNGVAKLCFGSLIPRYSTTITNTIHKNVPAVANTTDYIIIAGGQTTDGANPVKTVTAYSSSLVATQAADMPTQSNYQGACGFNGYAIVASGKNGNSGNSRTNQVLAYSNNLTVSSLPTLSTAVYESTAEGNDVHFIVQGGTYYSSNSYNVTSYDTNFVKSTPATMANYRRNHSSAAVGNYIVCCGCFTTQAATDFYDNTNVKTTATSPYNKANCNPLGLSTNNYAIFFGGSTSQSVSTAYADCKAYDKNKVLSSFNLPVAVTQAQGFSTGDYAFVSYSSNSFVYDDNLVLVEHLTDTNYGYSVGTQGAATDSFAIIHPDWSTSIRVLTV